MARLIRLGDSGDTGRTWPTPGRRATFRCVACEGPLDVTYHPGAQLECPGCATPISMPPLPPWYHDPAIR